MRVHNQIRIFNNQKFNYNLNSFIKIPQEKFSDNLYSPWEIERLGQVHKAFFYDDVQNLIYGNIISEQVRLSDAALIDNTFNRAIERINDALLSFKKESIIHTEHSSFWKEQASNLGVDIGVCNEYLEFNLDIIQKTQKDLESYLLFLKKLHKLSNRAVRSLRLNEDGIDNLYNEIKDHINQASHYFLADYSSQLIEYKQVLQKSFKDLSRQYENIFEKISESMPFSQYMPLACHYVYYKKNQADIESILKVQELKNVSKAYIETSESQKIQEVICFNDSSIAYKESGCYKVVKNQEELSLMVSLLEKSCIAHELRKKPKLANFFIQKHEDETLKSRHSFHKIQIAINSYLEHEQILKNKNINYNLFLDKGAEEIDDFICHIAREYKIEQYVGNILSNKYKYLVTDTAMTYFGELYDNKYSADMLQTYIGKKIAALKTPEEFTEYVKKVFNNLDGFNHETISKKANTLGAKEISMQNDVLVLEITSFEQSEALGSSSWCIARDDVYFSDYTSDGKRQFFIYDFSKPKTDIESMIGITLSKDGNNTTQHSKDDEYFNYNKEDFMKPTSTVGMAHADILISAFKIEDISSYYRDNLLKKKVVNVDLKSNSFNPF